MRLSASESSFWDRMIGMARTAGLPGMARSAGLPGVTGTAGVTTRQAEPEIARDPAYGDIWHDGDERFPLVVDLDGTLVRSDLLIEAAFREIGRRPAAIFGMVAALRDGKAALKEHVCADTEFDPANLPYDEEVLALIRRARADGREVYLASASHERLVAAVARHLDLFDGYYATDMTSNLSGANKAERLVAQFGNGGFDYVGNDAADLDVWARARNAIAIRTAPRVARKLAAVVPTARHLDHERPTLGKWARQLRLHQYAKNGLVFLPLLAAHLFDLQSFVTATLAAVAFSFCASAVYILNDLFDLSEDRRHRTKRYRPLASGDIPLGQALVAVPLLLAAAAVLAVSISFPFAAVLAGYFALTSLYSVWLKRIMLIDVMTLAGLYMVRIVGGAVALDVGVSAWLFAFALSIFVSLALIKRFVELTVRVDAGLPDPSNRDYRKDDLGMLAALAAAAGFNAITVLALYVSSESVNDFYSNPEILWLACPVMTYWIGRALMLAQRRQMRDDPIVFALKDWQSRISGLVMLGLFIAAS